MSPTSLRLLKAVCISGAATLVLGACNTGSTPATTAQTLRFPLLGDFATLDPGIADAETDSEINQNMFNGLVRFDNNLNIVPDIASAMPVVSADGLTYTFTLRHDVTFSNGDKVTSKDFLYSWNRAAALQISSYSSTFSPVVGYSKVSANKVGGNALEALLEAKDPAVWLSGLSAPDDYTVKVQLSHPAGWWLSALSVEGATGMVVDQNEVKKNFNNWWSDPATAIGTGAYKMTSRVPKATLDFAAVPNWWGSPTPQVTKIHIDIIPDASTAIAKYEQGGYDLYGFGGYSGAPVADVLRIQGTPNEKDQLLIHAKVRTSWIDFNMVHSASRPATGPFLLSGGKTAHDLRLAFVLAIDKVQLASIVCKNILCQPATGGLIAKGLTGYMGDGLDPLGKFDPVMAKQLLKSADPTGKLTQGMTYYYDSDNNPLFITSAPVIQEMWQTNLGVHVEIKAETHAQLIPDRQAGKLVLVRGGWQADYNNPQDWFDGNWGKLAGCPTSCNSGTGYDTAAYDALAAQADTEPIAQATADYAKLNQMLIDDVAYIPLFYHAGTFLIKPYVKGAGTNNFFDYWWNQYSVTPH
jgi:oligopeptide transport system substrate-binding protein